MNLRTRKSEGDQRKQKRNKGRRRQQHAANPTHLHEEGDNRSLYLQNRLSPLVQARNNNLKHEPHRK